MVTYGHGMGRPVIQKLYLTALYPLLAIGVVLALVVGVIALHDRDMLVAPPPPLDETGAPRVVSPWGEHGEVDPSQVAKLVAQGYRLETPAEMAHHQAVLRVWKFDSTSEAGGAFAASMIPIALAGLLFGFRRWLIWLASPAHATAATPPRPPPAQNWTPPEQEEAGPNTSAWVEEKLRQAKRN